MQGIDWDKAPKDATHVWELSGEWYRFDQELLLVWCYDEWVQSGNPERRHGLTENPKLWNGEGLPTVGATCEWKEKTGFQWVKAEVLFVSEQSIVLRRFDGFEWQLNPNRLAFRVFKTPEQIKAEELHNGVQKIMDDAGITDSAFKDDPEAWVWAAALYNKGYCKQEDK